MKETVNHPSHYQSKAGLEVIDVINAFTAELTGEEAFNTGNILKYVCRWKSKNGVEDLKKAKWYLDRLISSIGQSESTPNLKRVIAKFDDIYKAAKVLSGIKAKLAKYGYVSGLDLKELAGYSYITPELTMSRWTNLDNVIVRYDNVFGTYIIEFPIPDNWV